MKCSYVDYDHICVALDALKILVNPHHRYQGNEKVCPPILTVLRILGFRVNVHWKLLRPDFGWTLAQVSFLQSFAAPCQ